MRRINIEEEAVTNDTNHPWRVTKGPLRFGDKVYQRGAVVPDEIVDAALNVARLIEGRHIARMPAPKATAVPAALAHIRANPPTIVPSDPWRDCVAHLELEAAKMGITKREAGNLRHNLERVERAIRHRASSTFNRPVDALYEQLFAE